MAYDNLKVLDGAGVAASILTSYDSGHAQLVRRHISSLAACSFTMGTGASTINFGGQGGTFVDISIQNGVATGRMNFSASLSFGQALLPVWTASIIAGDYLVFTPSVTNGSATITAATGASLIAIPCMQSDHLGYLRVAAASAQAGGVTTVYYRLG